MNDLVALRCRDGAPPGGAVPCRRALSCKSALADDGRVCEGLVLFARDAPRVRLRERAKPFRRIRIAVLGRLYLQ